MVVVFPEHRNQRVHFSVVAREKLSAALRECDTYDATDRQMRTIDLLSQWAEAFAEEAVQ